MATLVAIAYPDEETAEEARRAAHRLESGQVIQAEQVAAITRDSEGRYHVSTTHGSGGHAWLGGFWGLLFGSIFLIPVAGLALGAGLGALLGHRGKHAIDKQFQQQVRDALEPGTSALFMVIEKATPDKAIAGLAPYGGTVISTSLSDEDKATIQQALSSGEAVEA
jgi:uncharacterized membrane protein